MSRPAGIFPGSKVFHLPPPAVEASSFTSDSVKGSARRTVTGRGDATGEAAAIAGVAEMIGRADCSAGIGVTVGVAEKNGRGVGVVALARTGRGGEGMGLAPGEAVVFR